MFRNIAFTAPNVLHIDDQYKLVDDRGKKINIEVRGHKCIDTLWFKASDCEKTFNFNDIALLLCDVESSFQDGIHYHYFYVNNDDTIPTLFLSFLGLSSMFFNVRRHPMALPFQCWVIHTLLSKPKQHMIYDMFQRIQNENEELMALETSPNTETKKSFDEIIRRNEQELAFYKQMMATGLRVY